MSRKDPRASLSVPLSGGQIRWLRRRARGRSLADALRRAVEQALPDLAAADPAPPQARRLALQLPGPVLARVKALCRDTDLPPRDIVRAALAHAMIRDAQTRDAQTRDVLTHDSKTHDVATDASG